MILFLVAVASIMEKPTVFTSG